MPPKANGALPNIQLPGSHAQPNDDPLHLKPPTPQLRILIQSKNSHRENTHQVGNGTLWRHVREDLAQFGNLFGVGHKAGYESPDALETFDLSHLQTCASRNTEQPAENGGYPRYPLVVQHRLAVMRAPSIRYFGYLAEDTRRTQHSRIHSTGPAYRPTHGPCSGTPGTAVHPRLLLQRPDR